MIDEPNQAVALTPGGAGTIVRSMVSVDEAVAAWEEYNELRRRIASPSDFQKIADKEFLKKSYWRKLQKFFNLRIELMSESEKSLQVLIRTVKKKKKDNRGNWNEFDVKEVEYYPMDARLETKANEEVKITVVFSAVYRALAGNGTYVDADGHADIWEKGYPNSYHNAKATASTRAKNRAISDLVGGGELSAEELAGEGHLEALVTDYEARIREAVLAAMNRIESKEALKSFVEQLAPILKDSPHAAEIRSIYKSLYDRTGRKEDDS